MSIKNTDPQGLARNNGLFSSSNFPMMSRERWEGIVECKRKFLADESYDPRECPYMDPDIAASWIRSRKMGADPYLPLLGRSLKKEAFFKVQDRNRSLIKITTPLMNTFKNLAIANSYGLYLTDNQSIFLLHEGEMLTLPVDAPLIGMIWDEENVGTTAHAMSLHHKRPFTLFGIENFCVGLENIVASAACIGNENGDVIASIVLAQVLMDEPWKDLYQKYCAHTLALITAISTAVESQLRLHKSFASLKVANKTLETTLALIDEGIITIDQNGTIVYSNEEGRKIFRLSKEEVCQKNIRSFLEKDSMLMAMAKKGESGNIEETIHLEQIDKNYLINVQPVIDENTQEFDGALLRINSVGKINAITANRAGAVARFTFDDIIGESEAIKKAITKGQYYATTAENILLIGESGTGKELFAQSIHHKYCPSGPFIAVNCAALPRELIESELFGYEGGSFTGADRSGRPGKIELAEGGTLFLDEIGDMPFELQAVLLRVLEDKQVMRIGARRSKKVNFKVIAATNQNLYKMVKEKRFREDLFYRLSVLNIAIPSLRDRDRDSELLTNYFIKKYSHKMGRNIPKVSASVLSVINEYNWPGNVRELENAIVHAVINSGEIIEVNDLPENIVPDALCTAEVVDANLGIEKTDRVSSLADLEKNAITKALNKANGNVVLAACLLDISKSTIYRKLKEYNISF
ncbi:sigma 54-interacting transcriptional regulator [Dehalobacter sp. DCM]|uniref:sigma-54 interaction domain-containing protein n=1 Tax=Dehalobacter sp. DCM TaxID=2907827 RepID=UPI003081FE41|nr:sigma 54-interacting transcriptional regulator [Dehalobacter sp. DCM]